METFINQSKQGFLVTVLYNDSKKLHVLNNMRGNELTAKSCLENMVKKILADKLLKMINLRIKSLSVSGISDSRYVDACALKNKFTQSKDSVRFILHNQEDIRALQPSTSSAFYDYYLTGIAQLIQDAHEFSMK